MRPVDALARRDGGEIELAPPTWMTLFRLADFATVADALAEQRVAVWDGHNYAVEAMVPLGLDAEDGAVRAGVSVYTTDDDVGRLLAAVAAS